jgi:hypothetical protein
LPQGRGTGCCVGTSRIGKRCQRASKSAADSVLSASTGRFFTLTPRHSAWCRTALRRISTIWMWGEARATRINDVGGETPLRWSPRARWIQRAVCPFQKKRRGGDASVSIASRVLSLLRRSLLPLLSHRRWLSAAAAPRHSGYARAGAVVLEVQVVHAAHVLLMCARGSSTRGACYNWTGCSMHLPKVAICACRRCNCIYFRCQGVYYRVLSGGLLLPRVRLRN